MHKLFTRDKNCHTYIMAFNSTCYNADSCRLGLTLRIRKVKIKAVNESKEISMHGQFHHHCSSWTFTSSRLHSTDNGECIQMRQTMQKYLFLLTTKAHHDKHFTAIASIGIDMQELLSFNYDSSWKRIHQCGLVWPSYYYAVVSNEYACHNI